jgi:hypothetical protein
LPEARRLNLCQHYLNRKFPIFLSLLRLHQPQQITDKETVISHIRLLRLVWTAKLPGMDKLIEYRRHDTQHNDIQHNGLIYDNWRNDTQHNGRY